VTSFHILGIGDDGERGERSVDHFLEFTIADSGKWLVMMTCTSHMDSTVFGFGLGHEFSLVEQKKKRNSLGL
jgi:hypothetical protein